MLVGKTFWSCYLVYTTKWRDLIWCTLLIYLHLIMSDECRGEKFGNRVLLLLIFSTLINFLDLFNLKLNFLIVTFNCEENRKSSKIWQMVNKTTSCSIKKSFWIIPNLDVWKLDWLMQYSYFLFECHLIFP